MAGQVRGVVHELLTQHYDPVYLQSMQRNFVQYGMARAISPNDRTVQAMQQLAQQVLQHS